MRANMRANEEGFIDAATERCREILNTAVMSPAPPHPKGEFKLKPEQVELLSAATFTGKDVIFRAAVSAGKTLGAFLVNDFEAAEIRRSGQAKNALCVWLSPSTTLRNEKFAQFRPWEGALHAGKVVHLDAVHGKKERDLQLIIDGKVQHGRRRYQLHSFESLSMIFTAVWCTPEMFHSVLQTHGDALRKQNVITNFMVDETQLYNSW